MYLKLIQVLYLLGLRNFSLYNGFTRWISRNQPLIDGVCYCPLYQMMKIHSCLLLMSLGILIEYLLI